MSKYHRFLLLTIVLVIGAAVAVKYVPLRKGLDLAGGVRVVMQADPKDLTDGKGHELDDAAKSKKMEAAIGIIRKRVEGNFGVAEPTVSSQGVDRILVELPGVKDKQAAIDQIKQTAKLEFYWLKDVQSDKNPSAKWRMMPQTDANGNDVLYFENTVTHQIIKNDTPKGERDVVKEVIGDEKPFLTGDDLKPTARGNIENGKTVISIEFNPRGTKIFGDFTSQHVGERTAILLGGQIVTAPTIETPILDGQAVITGFRSIDEAQAKADLLNSGALPITLHIVQMDDVEATLGKEVVQTAATAGMIGLILVLLFMVIVYRLPGLLADFALAIYAVLTFAAFKLVGVTMTLPGMAAFILSIGMAVDANILIFERLKEELRSGKTLHAAIDAGFARAFTAIFDSNMCTIITALILLKLGTGTVQSFAFTLVIGVLISMFTAITVTRTFLHLMMNFSFAQKPSLFGLGTSWFTRKGFNIVGRKNYYFALSALVIVPGLIFYCLNTVDPQIKSGLKQGIEFKPGTTMQLTFGQATLNAKFAKPVEAKPDEIREAVLKATGVDGTVKVDGNTVTLDAALGKADTAQLDALEKSMSDALSPYGAATYDVTYSDPKTAITATDVESIVSSTANVKNTAQISATKPITAYIRTDNINDIEGQTRAIAGALQARYGMAKVSSQSVGPTISKELTQNAIFAVLMAAFVIVLYLAFRFAIGGFADGLKYGITAITATLHDTLVIVGMFAILGHFLHWEIDTLFVTAVLTMIGFSTHDTIVVFDRIRENLKHRQRGETFEGLANRSILQTFTRSINTSFTVLLTIVALTVFGGGGLNLKHMYIALLVGIISGTYSSIFNATPLLVVWEGIANRAKSGVKKVVDDKTMIAKDLKPVAQRPPANGKANEGVKASEGDAADRVKVSPKRKKKRF